MSNVKSISRFFQYKCFSESLSTSEISVMRAFLNHGKYLKGRKYSFSSNMTQKPCAEIFVTSISEMGSPAFFDFISSLFNNFSKAFKFMITKSNAFCYLYFWVNPKFCFTHGTDNMDMNSCFFTGKEEKTITLISEYCRTHENQINGYYTKLIIYLEYYDFIGVNYETVT
jgi:hypothetical protein